MKHVQHRVCSLCEAMCGLLIETEDNKVVTIKSNAQDVLSQGAYCPKSQYLAHLAEDPDRLTSPQKRTETGFVSISWEQAFQEIGERVNALQRSYGSKAIGTYIGNPNVHNTGSMLFLPMFLKGLRTPNKFSASSVDQLPHQLVALEMFGHQLLFPIPDIDRTDFMLILGANPAVSNGSLMSAPGFSSRLKAISKRGGTTVVIDPRYTETASVSDEHHFIKPGSDVFFLVSFLQTFLKSYGPRVRQLQEHVQGLEDVVRLLLGFELVDCESRTGLSQEKIQGLVDRFAKADKAVCYGRMGLSTQSYGTVCQWMIQLINILSGNFDRVGGTLFTRPAFDVIDFMAKIGSRGSFGRRFSRVRGLPEFSGEFPSATLADEILEPGEGQIRGLFTIAGNPILSLPHGQKLEKAFAQLELHVAIDFYCNETTRHAHYILPPSSPLEHAHYDVVFNSFAVRNIARFSPAVLSKPKGAKDDWEILLELWSRIGVRSLAQKLQRRATLTAVKFFGVERVIDLFLARGPYKKQKLSCKRLKQEPNGVDLGPLEPSVPQRLYTSDKKIQLISPHLLKAWELFKEQSREPEEPFALGEFRLIGRRNLRSNNSWMHNFHEPKERHPCYLLMHREDAAALDCVDGQLVKVASAVGQVEVPIVLSDKIMKGVVSLPHGWGHGRQGARLAKAAAQPGVNLNDLTDDRQIDRFSGNAALNGQRVKVMKL